MKGLEASDDLDDYLPNVLFLHELFVVLAFANALEDISVVTVVHHNAQGRGIFIKKCFLISGYEGVFDGGQNSDFVQSILFLSVREILNFNFLESILYVVILPQDFVYTRV